MGFCCLCDRGTYLTTFTWRAAGVGFIGQMCKTQRGGDILLDYPASQHCTCSNIHTDVPPNRTFLPPFWHLNLWPWEYTCSSTDDLLYRTFVYFYCYLSSFKSREGFLRHGDWGFFLCLKYIFILSEFCSEYLNMKTTLSLPDKEHLICAASKRVRWKHRWIEE